MTKAKHRDIGGSPKKQKLSRSPAHSPCKGGGRNHRGIVVQRTLCDIVFLPGYAINTSRRSSPYVQNIKEKWETDPDHLSEEMWVTGWFPRRDVNAAEANQVMKAKPGQDSSYSWHGWVFVSTDPDTTPRQCGEHWAGSFTEHSAFHSQFGATHFEYLRDATTDPPQPVNHYFVDTDTVK